MTKRIAFLCIVLVLLACALAFLPMIGASTASADVGISIPIHAAASCSEDQGECIDGNDGCSTGSCGLRKK